MIKRILVLIAIAFMTVGASPALAQGWQTTIYPIYAWAPVFGADVKLPEIPNPPPCDGCGNGGPIVPGGTVNSNFNGAAFAAIRTENKYIEGEFNFLWAGMSADADRPLLKLKVNTVLGAGHIGYKVLPDLSVSAGVRRVALNLRASALVFDEVQWKPGLTEFLIGGTYSPRLSPKWQLLAHGDYGGIGSDNHSTTSLTGSVEWTPMKHFALNLGYGWFKLTADGKILTRDIHFNQTLSGPVIGIGIPF